MLYDYITNLKGGNMKYLAALAIFVVTPIFAQTYVITDSKGNVSQTIQIQGNQAQIINNRGYVTESITIYPNQVVTPQGWAIGTPSYTVPMSPPSPPSPRVLQ